ncbi:hypothetical protein CsSME_00050585 [Camellia sinensis var. sinensis]
MIRGSNIGFLMLYPTKIRPLQEKWPTATGGRSSHVLVFSSSLGSFTFEIWSKFHDVLGVVDDTDILYFIKATGEEITRITKKHLKVSLPIMGLIVHNSSDMNKSCFASVFSAHTSTSNSTLKEFPENVFCLNYHPETSLLAIVGGAISALVMSSGNTGTVFHFVHF